MVWDLLLKRSDFLIELNIIDNDTIENNLNNYIANKFSIICVLINEKNEIYNVFRVDTFDELKLQCNNFIDILNAPKFVIPSGFTNKQGFGGQFGLSTMSPIHFKFTNSYFINKDKFNKKLEKHLEGLNNEFSSFVKDNKGLIDVIRLFFENLKINKNDSEKIKNNNCEFNLNVSFNKDSSFNLDFKKNDYLIFLKDNFNQDNFIKLFNDFLNKKKIKKYNDLLLGKGYCYICNSYENIYKPEKGNFQNDPFYKHAILFHNRVYNYKEQKYLGYCKKCFDKLYMTFELLNNYKIYNLILPMSKNAENINLFKNLYFSVPDKNYSLLNSLYKISNNGNNMIDFILYQFKDSKREDYNTYFVNNYNYFVNLNEINNDLFYNINYNKNIKKDIIESINSKYNKQNLLDDLKYFFKNSFYENQLYFNNDLSKIVDPNVKYLLHKYRKSISDYIYLNKDYFFTDHIFDDLLLDVLRIIIKSNEFKDYYSINNIQKLLLKYYKINFIRGGKKMFIEKLKKLDDKINNLVENINNKDKIIDFNLEDDYDASYLYGHMLYYILSENNSIKKPMEQLSKELLNIANVEQLSLKTNKLYLKYSYHLREDNFIRILLNAILKYKFNSLKMDDHLIALLTGFTSQKNIFYTKLKGIDNYDRE